MKIKLIFFSLFIFGFSNSQIISGKIVSNDNNQAIPFARIGIENENVGAIADDNGNYKIDLSNVDRNKVLTVQLGGYESFSNKVYDFINAKNHDIILKEKISNIAEVKLTPKTFENKNWGINTKAKKLGFWFNSNNSSNGNWKDEVAISFSNNKKVKIEKINLNINQFETDKPVLLNFNIYSKEDRRPGKSILSEVLTVEVTKDQIIDNTFTFDISDKSIWVDKEDFYVSAQIVSGFKGKIGFSAALLGAVYMRSYYDKWEKIPVAAPAINIDVKVEKEKRGTKQ
ncbi:carboxypeptidase-like regulatory domain-containing protein [Chryseobacterium suipulveris]|uniref:Carboxypeptidase-like regulatory domain-containing protein n=1 Tax=Chryseobacterium suipulveris TaxID=2929800 RepID=A0ABY4BLJ9_9FLAO|nr:carboxypeptidase-like regulatory domain-containing protein [Chryseobacterium suipulveris]UOE40062.1 carboxypeptidase-like regulatory domain-containing protein [Chryseobacterium suipulveris]